MSILTKEVEIRLNANNVNRYKQLGYNIPMKEAGKAMKYQGVDYVTDFTKSILVKIEDLPLNSKAFIESTCDYCGKPKPLTRYSDYNKQTKNGVLKCCCEKCAAIKHKEIMLEKYGYETTIQVPEIRKKIYKTNNQRYGCNSPYGNPLIMEKAMQTLFDRYGVYKASHSKEILDKKKRTCLEKYGVEYITQRDETVKKAKQTNLQRFGYESPMQSPDFYQKWLKKNSFNFITASKQQRYLCNLYNGMLNHPFKYYALDIYIPENKLDIEFDGSGHKMSVSMGKITEEDFKKREIYRNVAIKNEGYKQMRIISIKDLLPSDQILLQMLSETKQYFSKYPNHSWIEFDIDSSIIRNAENKKGIHYDYGELRKIKKSDLCEFTI